MSKPKIEEFAQVLIREVRDRAIASCDNLLDPAAKGVVAKRWRKMSGDAACTDFAKIIIPDCIDNTLFYLLNAIDESLLRLSYTATDGSIVDLHADGESEMAGWYMASGEWRARYSAQRFVDDFEDL